MERNLRRRSLSLTMKKKPQVERGKLFGPEVPNYALLNEQILNRTVSNTSLSPRQGKRISGAKGNTKPDAIKPG